MTTTTLPTRILVTSGSTTVPIDRVRTISNVFRGQLGTGIASALARRPDCSVTLLTSHPELVPDGQRGQLSVHRFRTFDDLAERMRSHIRHIEYDVVIHSAAVSDYRVAGTFTRDGNGALQPVSADLKIPSSHPELFLQLAPTPKLIDAVRGWDFQGYLVKFKLEVGVGDEELVAIARKSRVASYADLIMANCLEWIHGRMLAIDADGAKELRADHENTSSPTLATLIAEEILSRARPHASPRSHI